MIRTCLLLLLLLNYLLAVGVGSVERPVRPANCPFSYEHRPDCQLTHQLRLACFDDCNGVQYTVTKQGERPPLHQLLTTLKGLDMHCLPELPPAFSVQVNEWCLQRWSVAPPADVPAGHRGLPDLPPRRG